MFQRVVVLVGKWSVVGWSVALVARGFNKIQENQIWLPEAVTQIFDCF